MNESKHTPGPWKVLVCRGEQPEIIVPKGYKPNPLVKTTFIAIVDRDRPEYGANARLIAAAPELLAACEIADAWFREQDDNDTHAEVVRAAIAKATGQD